MGEELLMAGVSAEIRPGITLFVWAPAAKPDLKVRPTYCT